MSALSLAPSIFAVLTSAILAASAFFVPQKKCFAVSKKQNRLIKQKSSGFIVAPNPKPQIK